MLDGQVLITPADADPCRVDEDINPTEPRRVLGHQALAVLLLTDVSHDRVHTKLFIGSLHLLLPPR